MLSSTLEHTDSLFFEAAHRCDVLVCIPQHVTRTTHPTVLASVAEALLKVFRRANVPTGGWHWGHEGRTAFVQDRHDAGMFLG